MKQIEKISKLAVSEIEKAKNLSDLESVRVKYLGRKSQLVSILRKIRSLSKSEKIAIGKLANKAKNEIEGKIENQKTVIKSSKFDGIEEKEKIDITYPGSIQQIGHLHPLTQVQARIEKIFESMGFLIVESREVEDEFHNFEALNIPKHHPARDMWDTFWLKNGNLMQTHTSPTQIRFMKENKPPLRIIVPGRVFRYEASDATHESNFHQIEGLMVDKSGKVTVANFKSVISNFLKNLFGKEMEIKMRPSYYPFVEPGFDINASCPYCVKGKTCRVCKNTGWIELMGAGMVNQKVFAAVGFKKNKYEGFAFGLGLDRIAMIEYGIDDIRLFYSGDLRFLEQF